MPNGGVYASHTNPARLQKKQGIYQAGPRVAVLYIGQASRSTRPTSQSPAVKTTPLDYTEKGGNRARVFQ